MNRLCLLTLSLLGIFALGLSAAQPPEMPKPSPEHAYLKKTAGNWDCVMNMMGQKMKCTHSSEMVGDFWVAGKFNGDFGGMKFEGRDTSGWDPEKKQYVSTWIDSMSPYSMTLYGTFDAASKTMTLEGMGVHQDGKKGKFKEVIVWKNDDAFTMTMHEEKDGKYEVGFSIDYQRRK